MPSWPKADFPITLAINIDANRIEPFEAIILRRDQKKLTEIFSIKLRGRKLAKISRTILIYLGILGL